MDKIKTVVSIKLPKTLPDLEDCNKVICAWEYENIEDAARAAVALTKTQHEEGRGITKLLISNYEDTFYLPTHKKEYLLGEFHISSELANTLAEEGEEIVTERHWVQHNALWSVDMGIEDDFRLIICLTGVELNEAEIGVYEDLIKSNLSLTYNNRMVNVLEGELSNG
jgi:hypothetical protein